MANNKMREALTKILNLTNSLDEDCAVDPVEIRDIAKAALAAPPRNCDVGTVKEQSQRFDAFCDEHKYVGDDGANWCSRTCPCYNEINCGVQWAQMPYEEGGAK